MEIKYRRMERLDVEKVWDLYYNFLADEDTLLKKILNVEYPWKTPMRTIGLEVLNACIGRPKRRIFVAETKCKGKGREYIHEIVGFIWAEIHDQDADLYLLPPFGYIRNVYVKPDFRNHGIGIELIKTAEKWFKEKKCQLSYMSCYALNEMAIKIYQQKLGYTNVSLDMRKVL